MRFQLIENWRQAHKLGSIQVSAVMATIFGIGPALADTWRSVPDEWREMLPHGWAHWIATGGFVLVLLARLTKRAPS